MKAKKIYAYNIDTEDVKKMGEVGEYITSHRRPLKIGDYVVLEVRPPIPFDDIETSEDLMKAIDRDNQPPEYCVLGKVSRFTEDGDYVFFMIVGDESS